MRATLETLETPSNSLLSRSFLNDHWRFSKMIGGFKAQASKREVRYSSGMQQSVSIVHTQRCATFIRLSQRNRIHFRNIRERACRSADPMRRRSIERESESDGITNHRGKLPGSAGIIGDSSAVTSGRARPDACSIRSERGRAARLHKSATLARGETSLLREYIRGSWNCAWSLASSRLLSVYQHCNLDSPETERSAVPGRAVALSRPDDDRSRPPRRLAEFRYRGIVLFDTPRRKAPPLRPENPTIHGVRAR